MWDGPMTCCALALVLCNFLPKTGITRSDTSRTSVDDGVNQTDQTSRIFAHPTNLRQRSITIPQSSGSSITPLRVTLAHPFISLLQPSHSFQRCWPPPRQRGPSWPVPSDRRRRLGPSPSCPRPPAGHFLRPINARASTSSSSSAPSWDSSTPSTSASTSGPNGRCRPSPRPSRSRWVAAPSVRSCFCFVVVDGTDVMARRIMPDTTTCTRSGTFQRPRAFGMRLPVWLTCILHSTHVV